MQSTKIFLVCLVIFFSDTTLSASGASGYRSIDYVRIGGGFVRVRATTAWDDPVSCNGATNLSIIVLDTDPSYQEIVSIILAAKMADKPIEFWISGCASDSGIQYPRGSFVYLK